MNVALIDNVMFGALGSAINASQLQQRVSADNIANLNTPGYKRQTVHFQSLLRQNLASLGFGAGPQPLRMLANSPLDLAGTLPAASSGVVAPVISTDSATSTSATGNNVNLDAEMSVLAQNQIQYGALVQELTDQFTMLRTAITGV